MVSCLLNRVLTFTIIIHCTLLSYKKRYNYLFITANVITLYFSSHDIYHVYAVRLYLQKFIFSSILILYASFIIFIIQFVSFCLTLKLPTTKL